MSDDYDEDVFEFSQQDLANMDAFEASLRSPSVEQLSPGLRAPIASTSSSAMDAVPDIEAACSPAGNVLPVSLGKARPDQSGWAARPRASARRFHLCFIEL